MNRVVFLRHGHSHWNLENRFTGWSDVDLSTRGVQEALEAGRLLREAGYRFDCAYTSVLQRAIKTLWIVQDAVDQMWLPVERDWRLNERHYGALQGLPKVDISEHYGTEQVARWRRGFVDRPPRIGLGDHRHPRLDARYRHLSGELLPPSESLEDTLQRVTACWEERIVPRIRAGERVLVVAHHNTFRVLVKRLEGYSDDEAMHLNIPTGVPLVYDFDAEFRVAGRHYLGDPDAVQARIDEVARQILP
ncbi:MAG: phosphoglyceromutase [Chromatiales bacterium 21-64-14]|nr:MAG: phosphoglyceromutase [Chromatiales bacterium 21-64-14]HQU16961.1 2,3-diphosphoglycerate-dependent phosphoglycerate mutase [Gammaproteobacteria bacterium]